MTELTKQAVYDALEDGLPSGVTLAEFMDHVEREVLVATINNDGGSFAKIAKRLGITREGFFKKRRRFGLEMRKHMCESRPYVRRSREAGSVNFEMVALLITGALMIAIILGIDLAIVALKGWAWSWFQ